MTALAENPAGDVTWADAADLRAAVENALARAECSFDELAAQAHRGQFTSMRARLAWLAIGDLHGADL
ncbi:hypothetical protein [Amycolatopsis sp. CA-230715]|uniref:hypothetical protein n=1 Tax=Amycolatopsis sp. CA-230715 TaxID=2745196 RepID=UPI001C017F06|nr:hypothetical protein [Amycolatopsis sp. CA-230715]QWF79206.1 hypothetical protein HUW46_02613 [Amycolatopsis sp. CA-230715]